MKTALLTCTPTPKKGPLKFHTWHGRLLKIYNCNKTLQSNLNFHCAIATVSGVLIWSLKTVSVKSWGGGEDGLSWILSGPCPSMLALCSVSREDGFLSPSSAHRSSCPLQVSLLTASGEGAWSYCHPATGSFGLFIFSSLHQAWRECLLCTWQEAWSWEVMEEMEEE